jgi:hypothetical protein
MTIYCCAASFRTNNNISLGYGDFRVQDSDVAAHTSNYSLVLFIQLSLLSFDLFVNSFSELLRKEPAVQLVLFM